MFLGKQRHFLIRFWVAALTAFLIGGGGYWLYSTLRQPTPTERSDNVLRQIQKLFDDGTAFYEKQDFTAAAEKFQQAAELAGRMRHLEEKRFEQEATERKPRKFEKTGVAPVPQREYSFSLREAEACRFLAASKLALLQLQMAAQKAGSPKNADAVVADAASTAFIRQQIETGLAANPRDRYLYPELYHLLGQLEILAGNYASAVNALEKAVELQPDFAEAYNDLGIAYSNPFFLKAANGGAYQQKAISAFEKALLVSADKPLASAHYNLGMFFAQTEEGQKIPTKQRTDAIRHLEAFLQESSTVANDPDVAHARKILEQLQGTPDQTPTVKDEKATP